MMPSDLSTRIHYKSCVCEQGSATVAEISACLGHKCVGQMLDIPTTYSNWVNGIAHNQHAIEL